MLRKSNNKGRVMNIKNTEKRKKLVADFKAALEFTLEHCNPGNKNLLQNFQSGALKPSINQMNTIIREATQDGWAGTEAT